MDKKLKGQWVAALRSGRYQQVTGELKADLPEGGVGYCCLGVLRRLMHPGSIRTDPEEEILCKEHAKEAGLQRRTQSKLASMNDDGQTFAQIANYIEKRL